MNPFFKEMFRACSDIRILGTRDFKPSREEQGSGNKLSGFTSNQEFDLDEFEDYYDELFEENTGKPMDSVNLENSVREELYYIKSWRSIIKLTC